MPSLCWHLCSFEMSLCGVSGRFPKARGFTAKSKATEEIFQEAGTQVGRDRKVRHEGCWEESRT